MTDRRKRLVGAARSLAWGHVLLHINVNIGSLDILPDWLGYLMIVRALPVLAEETPSAALLKPLGALLAVWEGILWVVQLLGIPHNGSVLPIIAGVVRLYFHFQLLTDLAAATDRFGYPKRKKLLNLRTAYALMTTALVLPIPWEEYEALTWCVAGIHAAAALWIARTLFSIRGFLAEPPPDET